MRECGCKWDGALDGKLIRCKNHRRRTKRDIEDEVMTVLYRCRNTDRYPWTEAEAKAYDDGGRWREGEEAVMRLRAQEIIDKVKDWR